MKRTICLFLILLTMSGLYPVVAQSYQTLWKNVKAYEQKDLPQSVVEEATKIYTKAKNERHLPQMLKAYLTRMQYRFRMAPDSLSVDVEALKKWAEESEKVEEKAILYSILGEILPPSDRKLAYTYFVCSLVNRDELLNISTDSWLPMVELNQKNQPYGTPNLYDLLARRVLNWLQQNQWNLGELGEQSYSLPEEVRSFDDFVAAKLVAASEYDGKVWALQIYQSLLEAYHTDAKRSAWLLTALDAWNYLQQDTNFPDADRAYMQSLQDWSEEYKTNPAAAHVCVALANFYVRQSKRIDALECVRTGMQRYPKSEVLNSLKNLEETIVGPSFSVQFPALYPGLAQQAAVTYKNVTQLSLEFYRLNLSADSPLLNSATRFSSAELKKYGTLEHTQRMELSATPDYLEAKEEVTIDPLQAGIYLVRVVDEKNKHDRSLTLLYVNSLKVIYQKIPSGEIELVVVDAESGHPITDAEVVTYTLQKEVLIPSERYSVNNWGSANLGFVESYSLQYHVVTPRDSYMPISTLWGVKGYRSEHTTQAWKEQLELFTDRGIYRPGQTIHLGGVLYKQLGDSTQIVEGKELSIQLLDSRYNEVTKLAGRTNAYGSFSTSFTLPTSVLPGTFTIQVAGMRKYVKVEEYRRPTFEVKLTPPTLGYKAGDSISITGNAKTYSDVPVANASVKYQVVRAGWWRWWGSRANWSGETVADAEGNFSIPVELLLDPSDKANPWYYNFRITATVTNASGESQVGVYSLPLGRTARIVQLEGVEETLWKEEEKRFTIKLQNLVGKPIEQEVTYQLFKATEKGERGEAVWQGKVASNVAFTSQPMAALPSGKYLFIASARDEDGTMISDEQTFLLLSKDEKRLPFTTDSWFCQVGTTFDSEQPATLYIGSSEKDVYLIYDLFAGNQRIDSQFILLTDSIVKFTYPYKAVYGDGIRANFAFVKRGKLYSHAAQISKPQPQKELKLTWETFRDKLTPGSQEVWKLKVCYPDGTPADAELMATLYDASLEALASHSWGSIARYNRSIPYVYWSEEGRTQAMLTIHYLLNQWEELGFTYHSLWIPEELVQGGFIKYPLARGLDKTLSQHQVVGFASNRMEKSVVEDAVTEESESLQPLADLTALRQNFAESAFFYPALHTDKEGVVTLTFTLPESLTSWKFKGYAHTKNMHSGLLEGVAVAAKKVMIESNLPRFVRAGDKVEFVASVKNRSEEAISGTVRMELFQPETNQVVASKKLSFKADSLEEVNLSFAIQIAKEERVLACRLVAEGKGFSDGEQRYLPVLSDQQWVTETVPFYVDKAGTKQVSLDKLFNNQSSGVTHPRLTVEFTAHPLWYVVQALPLLATPNSHDAVQWASALYASTLSQKILNDHPQLKQVIASLQAAGTLNESTFWSELQKNGDLKNTLWNETPWLREATAESEQRRRLATLIDVNGVAQQQLVALQQLKQLQTNEGSWSWYKGMPGNEYVTTQVAQLLVRMQLATSIQNEALTDMLTQAMSYLATQVAKEYEKLKEQEKQKAAPIPSLSEQTVRYLYLCSLDKRWIKDAKMHRYLVSKLAEQPTQYALNDKATAVVILQAAGESKKAQELLASIMQYSVYTPEMGRYFDTNRMEYSAFDAKIPTQVTVLEAMQVMQADTSIKEELKRWLLQQKQGQMWGNSVATTEAIYALLQTGGDGLAVPNQVVLKIGEEQIETTSQNPWGYVKQEVAWSPKMPKELVVTSQKEQLGWGAVYAQYLAPVSKIIGQSNGLHLTRTLLRGGKVITDDEVLQPGDAITVRLTLRADRTIDFVEIKEYRAACFEPRTSYSGYHYAQGIGYYQVVRDASLSFYMDRVMKGQYQLEYSVHVAQRGTFQAGISTVQSVYAPQFAGHTPSYVVTVK
ncbi:MAG: MG2 domain-containing protein [Phocaeicola sp.]